MAFQTYQEINFTEKSHVMIARIGDIIVDYQSQGYMLSVRQLYYQLVAKGLIENTLQSYKRTTSLVNDARMAGLLDWDAIEDRTREFVVKSKWHSPLSIMDGVIRAYHEDIWDNQEERVFVIVEKEALVGVLGRVCDKYDIPLLAARGYPSGTVLREFARDMVMDACYNGQRVRILHLGDHDPSGIDMSRDLEERINVFAEVDRHGYHVEFSRIALNMWQVEDQSPPPNPAKSTDSRFAGYLKEFGNESWELDALEPSYLNDLVEGELDDIIDKEAWESRSAVIEANRGELVRVRKLINPVKHEL